jgi:succinoglycan biosynthesis transport protein ExoP
VLIGVVMGAVAGISLALLREHTNDRVRTRDDAARVTGRSVIAAIPRRGGAGIAMAAVPRGGWGSRPSPPVKNEPVTLRAPDSAVAEAYRELRSNLVSRGFGTQLRRLLITSVTAGPETSTTVANLAVVCARSGLMTMAISADLRRPQLHGYFGVSDRIGLAAALDNNGASPEDKALPIALVASEVPNLLVLPSGRVPSSPGDVLASAPLSDIFGVATELAQVLIIEAPPILSGGDVLTLAAHADATLLVVRSGADKEALAARAAAALELAGCPFLGTILQGARRDDDTVGVAEVAWGAPAYRPAPGEPNGSRALSRPDRSASPAAGQEHGGSARSGAGEQRRPDGS